jgi:hypothetical protein
VSCAKMRYVGFWKDAEDASPSRGGEDGGHGRFERECRVVPQDYIIRIQQVSTSSTETLLAWKRQIPLGGGRPPPPPT